jgi:Ca2+-transporting ATPase
VTAANPFLPLAVAGSAGLALAALYLPALQDVLLTVPLAWTEIGAAALAGAVGFVAARGGGRGRILPAGRSGRGGPPHGARR